jgi:3-methyladenine DNA glycosylase AlkD
MTAASPDWSAEDIVAHLRSISSKESRAGMARFGIRADRAFGVSNPVLHSLARTLQHDHARALALWETGWREARLLATFTDDPKQVTRDQALAWAADFDSWEIVDHAAVLLAETPLADELVTLFTADEREFVRRAAFAMIAWSAVHLKKAPDNQFLARLPLIEKHSTDGRKFVKKAVSWALRQIGKRSVMLHARALALAEKLTTSDDRAARWIGKDAVKELTGEKTRQRVAARG